MDRPLTNTFDSYGQAEGITKIPKAIFSLAKSLGAPGLRGSRVYFLEFKPWYDLPENKERLDGLFARNDGLTDREIKRNNLILDGELKEQKKILNELEIKDRQNNMPDPEEIIKLWRSVGLIINTTINTYRQSHPHTVLGKPLEKVQFETNKMFDSLIEKIKKGTNDLNKVFQQKGINEPSS